ncbi:hypothetical protein CBR_g27785 [Chara braunii]|uniref:Reverse transcriptase n=1 Tax=Chara braunii TaxID=69332 RepID=A0A388L8B9_CHABU|nr:hypothetical protein CBR_g27785 [Chara braunii]|eukprot:GBG78561.1 hypothetical protein CBR_g27785 [Chara braunii]
MAELHNYLHAAVSTPWMEDKVAIVDLCEYIAKIDREYVKQRYDNIDAPLLYIRIQIGKATCSALIDCGATRNYISQNFMVRADLGPCVRRKSQPTQVTLADGRTHKSIDRCVDSVHVYFAPHACEVMSFDILDTKFDMILGMSWLRNEDHPVNFYHNTIHVRDRNGVLVPCTVPPPHPSIGCHVVSAANIRNSIARNDVEEMGICFLHALPPPNEPATEQPPDPRIVELLDSYGDVFEAPAGIVPDRPIRHEIILEDRVEPPRGCIYCMSEEELEVLRTQFDDLIDKGWIRPSCSPYGTPVLFVRKKNKELRLCIDYRKLNTQTIKNVGPLPCIDDVLKRLGDAKYFSKVDLKAGYHQLKIHPRDHYKTAFKTRYGHFEWAVMPFGLTNAPATFQATMTTEFRDMLDRFVLIYLDDILVYSWTLEEHIAHLCTVLDRLRTAKYKANRAKCEFAQQELEYLGHFVMLQGIRPLADKINAIQDWPEPTNTTKVRSFMGLAGYYQRFIGIYARIAAPLSRLQSPKVPFHFTDEVRSSFHKMKMALLLAPVLSIYDPTLPTRVTTDASDYDMGAVLEQYSGVDRHPVEYFSQKVPPINSVDDARKKELLAFVTVLNRWLHFLLGRRRFTWATDNKPLTYYKTLDTRPQHSFMSTFWTALMKESGTEMKPSSARHPQTDGQTERAHQTAEMMLRMLIRPDQKEWVERLPDIEFAYNTSLHPAIDVTPFELHHGGRKGRIFADLPFPRTADIDAACSPTSIWKYRDLLAKARSNMQKAQVRMQQQANWRRVPCPIRTGDLVRVSTEEFALEQDVPRKLLPKWFGPWTVTSAAGDEPDDPSFVIDIPPHLTVHPIFHVSKLATYTPAKSDDFPGRRSQDPPSMDGHQEVDRIITHRKHDNKPMLYKVTFKWCDRDDTQWISRAAVQASTPLIYAEYDKKRLVTEAAKPAPPTWTSVPPSNRQLRPGRCITQPAVALLRCHPTAGTPAMSPNCRHGTAVMAPYQSTPDMREGEEERKEEDKDERTEGRRAKSSNRQDSISPPRMVSTCRIP